MRTTVFAACGAVLALTLPSAAAVAAEEASARFIDREGEEIGEARLTEGPRGVLIQLQIEGLPAGPHGLHLHANGTCEDHDEGFQASGSHINPEERPHGLLNPDGPDPGDLPNIFAHEDGSVQAELFTGFVTLSENGGEDGRVPLLGENGAAFVIHEDRDDHRSQPIGGAGDRIACAVVEAAS